MTSAFKSINGRLHGDSKTKLYNVWMNMLIRCNQKNSEDYPRYSGRGISVCDEWSEYLVFKKWALDNGYKEGLFIDRIDNNGNYLPNNCRFVSQKDSNRNKSNIKLSMRKANMLRIFYFDGDFKKSQLARMFKVSYNTVDKIIKNRVWV